MNCDSFQPEGYISAFATLKYCLCTLTRTFYCTFVYKSGNLVDLRSSAHALLHTTKWPKVAYGYYHIVHTTPDGIEPGKFGSNRAEQLKLGCSTCSVRQELRKGGMFRHIWVTASMSCNIF